MKKITIIMICVLAVNMLMAQVIPVNWNSTEFLTAVEETTDVSEGSSSASLTWTNSSNQDLDSDPFTVTEGATFSMSFDALDNTADGRVRIGIFWGASSDYATTFSEDDANWQTLTLTGTVPVGATEAVFRIRCYDVGGGAWPGTATVIVDNAIYTEDGGANLVPNFSFETWEALVLSPELLVNAPIDDVTIFVDNVDMLFTTTYFELGVDGSVEYIINGSAPAYSTASPIAITGLVAGVNTIELQLVDMANAPLDPVVTVTRIINYDIEPGVIITSPAEGSSFYSDAVDVVFEVQNFVLNTDGKIAYSIDGGAIAYHTTVDAINFAGLSYAEHTVNFELVDMADASLAPAVTTSVTFTCLEPLSGGMEDFTNFPETSTSYVTNTFLGLDGSTWNYSNCSGNVDKQIDIPSPVIARNKIPVGEITSGTISGGCGVMNFDFMQAFSSNVNLLVYVNDIEVANITSSSQVDVVLNTGEIVVNQPGDFTFRFVQANTFAGQVTIDNISWSTFGGTDPYLSISAPVNLSTIATTDVDIEFTVYNFVLGTDGNIKYSVDGGADQFQTTADPIALVGLSESEHTVTLELVDIANAPLDPAVTTEVTFTVDLSAPTYTPIYDIQYTTAPDGNSPVMDQVVTTKGVVYAVWEDGFWLQDGAGAWNGLYVFDETATATIGDSVMTTGTLVEFYTYTELGTITNTTVINSSNTIAAATVGTTGGITIEDNESVLVTVTGVCTDPSAEYGIWVITDGSGAISIDDDIFDYTPVLGNSYTVTGVLYFSYDEWKIMPRDAADVIDNGASTDPLLSITAPTNGTTIYVDNASIEFTVSNFILGTDGKVAWSIDSGADTYVTASPISILSLSEGSHTVDLYLVDMSDVAISPAVTASVTFTINLAGPTYTNIADIQNGSATGDVWIKAIVSANFNGSEYGEGYYIQQGGGAWNGIYVYDLVNVPSIGDSVIIAGSVDEFFDMTQVEDITSYSVTSIDGIVANPTSVTTLGAADEQYESVLVKVVNAECMVIQNGYGEWTVNDGSGDLMCKDNGVFDFTEVLGTDYNITGIMGYSYGEFSLQYRRESDITLSSGIDTEFTSTISVYPNPATSNLNIVAEGAETITITNIVGQVIIEMNAKSEIETIDISKFEAGVYFVKIQNNSETAVIKVIFE